MSNDRQYRDLDSMRALRRIMLDIRAREDSRKCNCATENGVDKSKRGEGK